MATCLSWRKRVASGWPASRSAASISPSSINSTTAFSWPRPMARSFAFTTRASAARSFKRNCCHLSPTRSWKRSGFSKQTEPKKDELKKDEPKKDELKKDELKKDQLKKDEPKKDEPKKDEPKKEEPKKEELKKE